MQFPQKRRLGATDSLVAAGLGIAVGLLCAGAHGSDEVPDALRQRALEELRVLDRGAPRANADPRRGRFSAARPLARPAVRGGSSEPGNAATQFASPARKSAAEVTESLPEYRPRARQVAPVQTEAAGSAGSSATAESPLVGADDPFGPAEEAGAIGGDPSVSAEDPFGTVEPFGTEEEFEAPAAMEFGPPEPFEEEPETAHEETTGPKSAGDAAAGNAAAAIDDFTPVARPDSTPVTEKPAQGAPESNSTQEAFDDLAAEAPFDVSEESGPADAGEGSKPEVTVREEVLGAGRPVSVLEVLAESGATPAETPDAREEAVPDQKGEIAPEPRDVATTPETQERKIAERADRDGLLGFCPVTLREARALLDGLPEFSSQFEGETYLLASVDAKALFDSHPERYAPAAKGRDIVLAAGRLDVRGSLRHATWYRGRLYLFRSEQTCRLFSAAPERYVIEEGPAAP